MTWSSENLTSPQNFAMMDGPHTFVAPAEFRRLLVSHRRLERADDKASRIRGLRDVDTGELFLIEERRLHDAGRSS